MTNHEKLEEIERNIDELRGASMLTKAARAETIVYKTVGLVKALLDENEQLKKRVHGVEVAQDGLLKKVDQWEANYFGTIEG